MDTPRTVLAYSRPSRKGEGLGARTTEMEILRKRLDSFPENNQQLIICYNGSSQSRYLRHIILRAKYIFISLKIHKISELETESLIPLGQKIKRGRRILTFQSSTTCMILML